MQTTNLIAYLNEADRTYHATEKAEEILECVATGSSFTVEKIVKVIEEMTKLQIDVRKTNFSQIPNIGKRALNAAVMCVTRNHGKKHASILLNSDTRIDPKYRRFCLVYELGGVVIGYYNMSKNPTCFTVSKDIHYNFKDLNRCDDGEVAATIFALKVLLPFEQLYKKIFCLQNIKRVENYFGLPEEAIKSRLMLGA